jgi:uncharacterized damage-inducible protein DinB
MFTTEALREQHGRAHLSYDRLLDHVATLPAEALMTPLEGFGMPIMRNQLLHIADSEAFWLSRLEGHKFQSWNYVAYTDVPAMRAAFERVAAATRAYLEQLDDAALNAQLELTFDDGSLTTTPALVLSHVITHGFHHKGQVVAMCRLLGHPAPNTDFDVEIKPKLVCCGGRTAPGTTPGA